MTKMIKFVEENFPRIAKLTPLSIDLLNRITPKNNESYLLIYPDKSIRLLTSEDLIREVSSGNNVEHIDILNADKDFLKLSEENVQKKVCVCGRLIDLDAKQQWYHIDHDTYLCSEQYATPRKENNE